MHRDEKQCGILNYILEQKKDIRRKTGKIRIKDLVKFCTDVNFLVLTNVLWLCKSGLRARWVNSKRTLCTILATFL